ncbi:MAG: DUF5777 family beta-barrel protein [Bacteroidia bacterium]
MLPTLHRCLSFLLTLLLCQPLFAQDDLMDLLEDMEEETIDYTYATFKTVRVINGHSIEIPAPGVMQLIIAHRFGRINGGAYEFFGLDQANMRLGFEYGINNHLCVGVGRTNLGKTYDGFVKFKFLRQSTGARIMPVSVVALSGISANGLTWAYPNRPNYFTSRLSYTHQLLIGRKFSDRLSLQLSPTVVHRNLVRTSEDWHDIYLIGIGGRYKLTGSITVNAEYFYALPGYLSEGYQNSLSLAFDIETGGHVFQLIFSNSRAMTDNLFLTETDGQWQRGDIHFGFNLMRVFTVSEKARQKAEKW